MSWIQAARGLSQIIQTQFSPLARFWQYYLAALNAMAIFFFRYPAVLILIGGGIMAFLFMVTLYKKFRYIRLLGLGHLFWIPGLVVLFSQFPSYSENKIFQIWVLLILISNTLSLVIDMADAIRYLKGERAPRFEPQ